MLSVSIPKDGFSAPSSLQVKIVDSVDQLSEADWNRLFGDEAEGRPFFQTLEASNLEGFRFRYVVMETSRPILIAPIFFTDFDLLLGVEGRLRSFLVAVRRIFPRFLIEKTVVCGSPFGESAVVGIDASELAATLLFDVLKETLSKISVTEKLTFILFKDFSLVLDAIFQKTMPGYFRGESFPSVVLPLPYPSMESYLESLSKNARRDLRTKFRRAHERAEICVQIVSDVSNIIDEVYSLYLQTYNAGKVKFEKLTKEYFTSVGRLMDGVKFFLFYANGRLVCFNLCFHHRELLIDKFIGFDYEGTRELNLYSLTWYHNVAWCIENGVKSYQVGQTDYGLKLRFGGIVLPLSFFGKHRNPFIHTLCKWVSRSSSSTHHSYD